ncbi:MAG TPA: FG-GAP-like repeat-containing protein, partial [Thermoplasmata archaeon]|nr:FG-GAP-like repeat-containing protein [Thermoplasmata archaeon]
MTSRREPDREPKAHTLGALVLAWMLILTIILPTVAASDPDLTPFSPVDKKYTWEFDDLANYTLGSTAIDNGTLELASTQTSVSVASQQDFLNGTVSDIDTSDPGNITIARAMLSPFQFKTTLGSNNLSDTYLTNLTPTFNFGGASSLLIGNDALGVTYRSLLKIDKSVLDFLPSDAQLMSASLSIYQMSGAYPGNINIYSSSSDWTEGTGDWNGTLIWLWVNETKNVKRTNEPVIVDLILPPIGTDDPDRRLILYDSTGVEYPSRILNKTYSGGYLTSVRLSLAVTISALESECFSLRLVDAGGALPSYRNHAVNPVSLWSGSIGSSISVSPLIADFNDDGYLEIAFFDALTRSVRAYYWDGTPLWTYLAGENLYLSPTAADVNLDGKMELIYPSSVGLRVLDAETGTLLPGYTLPGAATSQAAVSDINGDGIPEIIVLSSPPRALYCLSGVTGGIIWQNTVDIPQAGTALAIGNFNASAGLEVAVTLNDGTVLTFNASGNLEWTARPSTDDYGYSFAVARLDGDQFDDLIIGANKKPGSVFALNGTTGKTLWSFSTATSSLYSSGLAVADINKDGYLETVALAATNGLHQVIAISNTGSELWNCTIPEIGGIGEISLGSISFADFNGDGDPEIFIGDRNGSVRVISSSGKMLTTITVSAAKGWQDNSPLFADLTGNDSLEMITSNDQGINVIGIYGFSYDWRMRSHDATLGSAEKNLSSAEGLDRLNVEWNAAPYPTMPANWTFAMDSIPWATPGGDYNPVPISSSSPSGAGTWTVLNITGIISAWVGSGRIQMDSIFFGPQDASVGIARFSSSNEPIFALHPIITVNYRLSRYAPSGSFVSDPLGFSWPNHWEWARAEWSAGSDTSVSIEVRIGNSSNPGDGTWSGWSLLVLPGDFSKVNASYVGSYLQFRITLSTANNSETPIFSGIEFGGISFTYHGWAMTADVNPPGGIDHWNQSWATYTSNEATVTLNYSIDGGSTWTSIAPTGDISKADISSGVFRLRVDLYSRDYPSRSATTPLVFNLTATYSTASTPLAPPYISPRIPDQSVMEDAPAWTVNLLSNLHDANDATLNLRW